MIIYTEMLEKDVPEVIELGARMHQESRYNRWEYDKNYCAEMAKRVLSEKGLFFSDIAREEGKLVGMMFGFLNRIPFCNASAAIDLIVYVIPEKRNGRLAMKLIKDYERWARIVGAEEIQLGVSSGTNPDKVAKFYNRLGYTSYGHFLRKEV